MFVVSFANNVGLFADNVGRSGSLLANNVGRKSSCLWAEASMFAGRYKYLAIGKEEVDAVAELL